jgi:phosphogluconate dehydratase
MCDGVTQGQTGMELSLFSRDVIAMATGVALSHNTFDAVLYLGVCDKIVPGLIMAACTFGYLPGLFVPAGPMVSGLPNDEKAKVRQQFAAGEVGRDKLMEAEMASYHGPGTCTFYGTANSNQMLMEFMGLHLPGASFVNPGTPLRDALTEAATERAAAITALGNDFRPVCDILDEKAFVNGIVGLMATGGSTNLVIHLVAMARSAGVILDCADFAELSAATPLMARVYPNGLADVNHFHAAGGLGYMIGELLDAGLLHPRHPDRRGHGARPLHEGTEARRRRAHLGRRREGDAERQGPAPRLRSVPGHRRPRGTHRQSRPRRDEGLRRRPRTPRDRGARGDLPRPGLGEGGVPRRRLNRDVIVVVRFQGPRANGMPELHALTPILAVLQDRGHKVALVTDGRMSGASGKVPLGDPCRPRGARWRADRQAARRRPDPRRRHDRHALRPHRRRGRPPRRHPRSQRQRLGRGARALRDLPRPRRPRHDRRGLRHLNTPNETRTDPFIFLKNTARRRHTRR